MKIITIDREFGSGGRELGKRLAEGGDCVIVGRCADVILWDMSPLNLFVYSDQESKLMRCRQWAGYALPIFTFYSDLPIHTSRPI